MYRTEETEKKLEEEHVKSTLTRAEESGLFNDSNAGKNKAGGGRGGRGGGRGGSRGGGGRGGGRGGNRNNTGGGRTNEKKPAAAAVPAVTAAETMDVDAEGKRGEKRKREAFEPEGAVGAGERGAAGVPVVVESAAKKVKTE